MNNTPTVITEPSAPWEPRHFARRIATFHQRETKTYNVPQEYAGARLEVVVPAGDYAIEICKARGYVYLQIVLPGTKVHYSWHSSHCHSSDDRREPYTYRKSLYDYQLAAMVERGDATLTDGRFGVSSPQRVDGERTMLFLTFAGSTHPSGFALTGISWEIGFNPFDDVTP